jgi:hypothetical protein
MDYLFFFSRCPLEIVRSWRPSTTRRAGLAIKSVPSGVEPHCSHRQLNLRIGRRRLIAPPPAGTADIRLHRAAMRRGLVPLLAFILIAITGKFFITTAGRLPPALNIPPSSNLFTLRSPSCLSKAHSCLSSLQSPSGTTSL